MNRKLLTPKSKAEGELTSRYLSDEAQQYLNDCSGFVNLYKTINDKYVIDFYGTFTEFDTLDQVDENLKDLAKEYVDEESSF